MDRRNDPLHDYVLELTGKDDPVMLFVPTATGDDASYIVSFYEAFTRAAAGRGEPTFRLLPDALRCPVGPSIATGSRNVRTRRSRSTAAAAVVLGSLHRRPHRRGA
jgi:hypothetical protein